MHESSARGRRVAGSRLISVLPLPSSLIQKLAAAGYHEVQHLDGLEPSELAEDLGIDEAEAQLALLQVLSGGEPEQNVAVPLKTGLIALEESRRAPRIITFVRELDALLGGGIQLAQLTEVAGAPGVGKTQLSIQLALNVQIPETFAGVGGEAVYIDSEGSFMAERAKQMAEALIGHLGTRGMDQGYGADGRAKLAALRELTGERLLRGIHVFRVHDLSEQLAVVRQLSSFIRKRRLEDGAYVRLVVIDSLAFHFRHGSGGNDYPSRLRVLQQLSQQLHEQSEADNFAAVLVNQARDRGL